VGLLDAYAKNLSRGKWSIFHLCHGLL